MNIMKANNWLIFLLKILLMISLLVFIIFIIIYRTDTDSMGFNNLAIFPIAISGISAFICFDFLARLADDWQKFKYIIGAIEVFLLSMYVILLCGGSSDLVIVGGGIISIIYFFIRKTKNNVEKIEEVDLVKSTKSVYKNKIVIILIGFLLLHRIIFMTMRFFIAIIGEVISK